MKMIMVEGGQPVPSGTVTASVTLTALYPHLLLSASVLGYNCTGTEISGYR